jgi:hypothetical protein
LNSPPESGHRADIDARLKRARRRPERMQQ